MGTAPEVTMTSYGLRPGSALSIARKPVVFCRPRDGIVTAMNDSLDACRFDAEGLAHGEVQAE